MSYTTAYTEISKYVDKYLLRRQLPQDDYLCLLQHACDCYRNINIRHSNEVVTEKVSISALGIIEMPTDMVSFSNLFVAIDGEWWSFTDKPRKVSTTTTTDGTEGQDSTEGEGVDVYDDMYLGYGGKGGVNEYYRKIDWKARRIFCDGIKSNTAVLQYVSSGLVVGGNTYVNVECEPVLDSYLDWQREVIAPRSMSMIQYLEQIYKDRLAELRIIKLLPTKDEISDVWDRNSTQAIQR